MLAADGEIILEVFLCHVQHEVATVGDAAFTYQVMVAVGILLGEGDNAKVLGTAEADTDDQTAVAFLVYLRTEAMTALVAGDILGVVQAGTDGTAQFLMFRPRDKRNEG